MNGTQEFKVNTRIQLRKRTTFTVHIAQQGHN